MEVKQILTGLLTVWKDIFEEYHALRKTQFVSIPKLVGLKYKITSLLRTHEQRLQTYNFTDNYTSSHSLPSDFYLQN